MQLPPDVKEDLEQSLSAIRTCQDRITVLNKEDIISFRLLFLELQFAVTIFGDVLQTITDA